MNWFFIKEKVKLIFKKPLYYICAVTFVYLILTIFWFWPNMISFVSSLRIIILTVFYFVWLLIFMALWAICAAISYVFKR